MISMTGRRWRALGVGLIASVALSLGVVAVFASARLAGAILSVVVLLLALILYREIERAAAIRARAAEIERLLTQTASSLQQAEGIDPVTRLANRTRFFERLQEDFRRSTRYERPLACVMLDLDRFSQVNELYGQHFGDIVLAEFSRLLLRDLRETDLAVRYEGETFAIILPETSVARAELAVDRIRGLIKGHVFSDGVVACALTACYGIAGTPDPRISRVDDLVHFSAQALSRAKRRGPDQVATDAAGLQKEPAAEAHVESSEKQVAATERSGKR